MADTTTLKARQTIEGLSFLGVLQDCLACGLVCLNEEGRIASLTAEAADIMGLEAQQTVGCTCDVLPAPLASLAQDTLFTGKAVRDHEVEFHHAHRGTLAVRVNAVHLAPAEKNLAVIIVLNDLTSARRLEHSMGRLDRLASIGALAASMAHEIKNALVAVKTFTELAATSGPTAELGDVARRELKRIEAIVSGMLKFAAPARPAFAPVGVHEILDHSLRLIQHQMEQKTIRLKRDYQAAPDQVKGDDYQLEQVFVNLMLNALEAMGVGGTLTVATQLAGPDVASPEGGAPARLCVTLSDTGAGIPPENLARLFEPFFTTKRGGTGLGLAIAQRILEEHNATISATSELNRGASFSVLLPLLRRA
jgi:two-component system sensor histidine kinase HydH